MNDTANRAEVIALVHLIERAQSTLTLLQSYARQDEDMAPEYRQGLLNAYQNALEELRPVSLAALHAAGAAFDTKEA